MDSASAPPPVPPMDIVLAMKQHRVYSPAGQTVKISGKKENCYYQAVMQCLLTNHGTILPENIKINENVNRILIEVHKHKLRQEFGMSF